MAVFLFLFSNLINSHVFAEDADPASTAYIPLTPSFVVNYISENAGLSYIKTDITLRTNEEQQAIIEANMPLVKDAIVMFLSSRTNDQVTGAIAREATRAAGAVAVNEALQAETGTSPIQDILFSSFVTQ
ncbi:flagellar basal body-associated FliL family protein [Marinomonas sp. GJ51-6]|uniref:flagellar basal body-associated FliL family protein n=1 Tax=Marinomonas sp. GJ51-6 TaxID=2992802 RepID=UPI0029348E74|nr:flagellar basal body-associated FliL family protein [Marinomonas sp. GJ51-6]WOD09313.1 flagellar basal body-associated FliL family protein [Marinomonas sp. GJ51-6]